MAASLFSNIAASYHTRPREARDTTQAGMNPGECTIFVVPAISNIKILPNTFSVPASPSDRIVVIACAGEREPASFVVRSRHSLDAVTFDVSDLTDGRHRIEREAVDIRIVKCWFQSGTSITETNRRVLTPELLLKDDDLIRVDLKRRENYLRSTDAGGQARYLCISSRGNGLSSPVVPRDADRLQPVSIEAGIWKQFWVTVQVPEDAVAGQYTGTVRATCRGVDFAVLTICLRVLPFRLSESRILYSMYYRGFLTADGSGSISSEQKTEAQYLAEMRNMAEHGVRYPTSYQGLHASLFTRTLELRAAAGLPRGVYFGLGRATGAPTDEGGLTRLSADVQEWRSILMRHGYDQAYFYGIDEATGQTLASQRAAWRAVHGAGGKVFVACARGAAETIGDLLDVAVCAGPPDAKEASAYHRYGHEIFCYGNPQVGVEEPETYRRNFGLLLWKSGYDGAMNYAYQHAFGHIWNDFDDPECRDHVFAYPTVDGVIDTVEWEGFREAVDDVRYLSTLLDQIDAARRSGRNTRLAEEAVRWITSLNVRGDLQEIRSSIVRYILRFLE